MSTVLTRMGYCLRAPSCSTRYIVVYGKQLGTWRDRLKRWHSSPKSENKPSTESTETDKGAAKDSDSADNGVDDNPLSKLVKERDDTIAQQKTELEELNDKYLRALAETENVRHRMEKQLEDVRMYGIQGFAKDLLEIADVLEKAIESVDTENVKKSDNKQFKSLHEGLVMTQAQLQKIFTKNGLERINPMGEKFDPKFHEALYQVKGDKPGFVMDVTQIGYMLHGRTIRSAKVGVNIEQ